MSQEKPLVEVGRSESEEVSTDGMAARYAGLMLLEDVLQRKQALDQALDQQQAFKALPMRDRAFTRMMVSTILRRLGQIDNIIERAIEREVPRNITVQNVLRIGVVQILFMDVADHAAVDTSVKLAEKLGMEKQKAFVNAVLRTVTREGVHWRELQDEVRLNTPEWLLKIWIEDYGLRMAAEIAKANLSEAALDISVRDRESRNFWASNFKATQMTTGTLRKNSGGAVHDLQGFDEDFGTTLPVVQSLFLHRQVGDLGGFESALAKPVRGASGQHEQPLQALLAGAAFDMAQQGVGAAAVAVARVHGDAGQFAHALLGERIERGAADDGAVAFQQDEAFDLHFQPLARAPHQGTVFLQRSDQFQDAAHIVDGGGPQPFVNIAGDQGAHPVAGEQLQQQCAVDLAAEQVNPAYPGLAGAQCLAEVTVGVFGQGGVFDQQPVGVAEAELTDRLTSGVAEFRSFAQYQQLVGAQSHGGGGGHLLGAQVENFPGRRIT